jgi:hypothetical protein
MPAKIIDAMTLAWHSPPRSQPTIAAAKSKMRFVTPALFITWPIRMNSGAATNVNEFAAETCCWTMIAGSTCWDSTNTAPAIAIASQIGGPRNSTTTQTARIASIAVVTVAPPLP